MSIIFYLLSILLAIQAPSLQHNFTYFSYTPPFQYFYYLWFFSLGTLIYYKIYLFSKHGNTTQQWLRRYVLLLYLIGGLLPYTPSTQNWMSSLHVSCSTMAILLSLYSIYYHLQSIVLKDPQRYQKGMLVFTNGILSFFPLLLIQGSITIGVELYCLGWVLYLLHIV